MRAVFIKAVMIARGVFGALVTANEVLGTSEISVREICYNFLDLSSFLIETMLRIFYMQ